MRILVEGKKEALQKHSQHVVARLADCVDDALPDLAEMLRKSAQAKQATFDHPVLEHLRKTSLERYSAMLMLLEKDIAKVALQAPNQQGG